MSKIKGTFKFVDCHGYETDGTTIAFDDFMDADPTEDNPNVYWVLWSYDDEPGTHGGYITPLDGKSVVEAQVYNSLTRLYLQ